jgi:hypothetical protein
VLDVFLAFARAARHPVALAQLVEHGPADALAGEGFELHSLGGFVAREGFRQAHHAHLDQVVQLHIGRQLRNHVVRNPSNQRNMLADQRITIELAFGGVHHRSVAPDGLCR